MHGWYSQTHRYRFGIYSQSQRYVRAVRLPSEEGSVPESVVELMSMYVSAVRLPRESGIVPDKSVLSGNTVAK
eukprot:SAG31_NODE_13675_length_853_cov_43.147215_1_plen_73_part_00